MIRLVVVRLLPVVMIVTATGLWFYDVQAGGPFVIRNLVPPAIVLVLAAITLGRGKGRWAGSGWRLPLGTFGYSIPALGLSIYLHYAYSVNLNGMFDDAAQPDQLFRYLPLYEVVAGAVGFAIGWIVGRNV